MQQISLMQTAPDRAIDRPQRRYDLDWLRVFAVLLLLYFHIAAIFYKGDLGEFYAQSDRTSGAMNLLIAFVYQ